MPTTPTDKRISKPWGFEVVWARTQNYVGKVLSIRAGHRLSLQHHDRKEETLRVVSGSVRMVLENDAGVLITYDMSPGDVRHVAPGRRHRIEAVTDAELVEVSTVELEDVVRHADDYGRQPV
jgi:mannose-6-phosphate isomerase-like protein (cupin superfamily)